MGWPCRLPAFAIIMAGWLAGPTFRERVDISLARLIYYLEKASKVQGKSGPGELRLMLFLLLCDFANDNKLIMDDDGCKTYHKQQSHCIQSVTIMLVADIRGLYSTMCGFKDRPRLRLFADFGPDCLAFTRKIKLGARSEWKPRQKSTSTRTTESISPCAASDFWSISKVAVHSNNGNIYITTHTLKWNFQQASKLLITKPLSNVHARFVRKMFLSSH